MTTITQGADRAELPTLLADHGLVDEKGRTIGGIAYIGEGGRWDRATETFIPDGTFCFRAQAARDGKAFGATTRSNTARFATVDGAVEAAKRALVTQGNRYREQDAKHQARQQQA